jgi:hypothetical protein
MRYQFNETGCHSTSSDGRKMMRSSDNCIFRRLPGAHGHIDFVDLASPNFPVRAAILRDKNAMQAPLGRAKSGVVEAIKLVEMNGDELFPGRALQVANKSGTNSYLVATATLLRRPERLADGWRVALERRG